MKILVVSLLRLGDLIQQEPLLRALREKYPEAEVHLLINRQFANASKVLGSVVDRYVYFDRETLQKGLGNAGHNILWSYRLLEDLVSSLNSEKYDIAFNFTHNKLSAYLLGSLNVPQKNGLFQEEGRFAGLSNRWIRYFNARFSGTEKSLFHYVELLGNSFSLPVKPQQVTERKRSKRVLFQCLTSDLKKNWGLNKFYDLKAALATALPDHQVLILAAPFEQEQLLKVFSERDLLICDIQEARRHLQEAAVLVTGDTSIKHLAAQVGTPIVELVLGSSDVVKTGAYIEGARSLVTQVPCAPCMHSQACNQARHFCGEDLAVDEVFAAVWDLLSGERHKKQDTEKSLERGVWQLYLDKAHREVEPFYRVTLENLIKSYSIPEISMALNSFAERSSLYSNWKDRIVKALPPREVFLKRASMQASEISGLILIAQEIIKSKKDEASYFQGFIESLLSRYRQPVQIYDRVFAALEEVEELLVIRENLYRHLQTVSMEGVYYAKGIGQLSINGFEETGKSLQRDFEDTRL